MARVKIEKWLTSPKLFRDILNLVKVPFMAPKLGFFIAMTINKAKKILGKLSEGLSDEELTRQIELSEYIARLVLQSAKGSVINNLKKDIELNKGVI
jgi:hypothetical protein